MSDNPHEPPTPPLWAIILVFIIIGLIVAEILGLFEPSSSSEFCHYTIHGLECD